MFRLPGSLCCKPVYSLTPPSCLLGAVFSELLKCCLPSLGPNWSHQIKLTLYFQVLTVFFSPQLVGWRVHEHADKKGWKPGLWGVCVCSVTSNSLWPPWTVAHHASLSMGFPRRDYLSGLAFPPRDLSDPGIEPMSPASPELAGGFFTIEPSGKPCYVICLMTINSRRARSRCILFNPCIRTMRVPRQHRGLMNIQ